MNYLESARDLLYDRRGGRVPTGSINKLIKLVAPIEDDERLRMVLGYAMDLLGVLAKHFAFHVNTLAHSSQIPLPVGYALGKRIDLRWDTDIYDHTVGREVSLYMVANGERHWKKCMSVTVHQRNYHAVCTLLEIIDERGALRKSSVKLHGFEYDQFIKITSSSSSGVRASWQDTKYRLHRSGLIRGFNRDLWCPVDGKSIRRWAIDAIRKIRFFEEIGHPIVAFKRVHERVPMSRPYRMGNLYVDSHYRSNHIYCVMFGGELVSLHGCKDQDVLRHAKREFEKGIFWGVDGHAWNMFAKNFKGESL